MSEPNLFPLLVVVFVAFPVLWLWGCSMSATFLAHHAATPILQQTLVDLVNADAARLHIAAITVSITAGAADGADRAGLGIVPEAAFHAYTWLFQFLVQVNIMYLSYGVLVRYAFVLSGSVIVEGVSDGAVLWIVRGFSAAASAAICAAFFYAGFRPDGYVAYLERHGNGVEEPGNATIAFPVLTSVALAVNVVVRIALWREAKALQPTSSSQSQHVSQSGKIGKIVNIMNKVFVVVVVLVATHTARLYIEESAVPKNQLFSCVTITIVNSAVTGVVLRNAHIRKFAKASLRSAFGRIKSRLGLSKVNLVAPVGNQA